MNTISMSFTRTLILAFSAAMLLVAPHSCKRMETDPQHKEALELIAETCPQTRTHLKGSSVVWHDKDSICVFDASGSANLFICSSVSEDSLSAHFQGNIAQGTVSSLSAVYPYNGSSVLKDGSFDVSLPSIQHARPGSFARGLGIAAARGDASRMHFQNVCGLLCFKMGESGVTAVCLQADQALAGHASVSFAESDGTPVAKVTEGSKSIELRGNFVQGQVYYITAYPGSYTGRSLQLTKANGSTATIAASSDEPLVINRSGIVNIGTVSVPDGGWSFVPDKSSSIYGRITSAGTPLQGVVVTDGYLTTATDSQGWYQLASAKKNGMVYISTPAGYTAQCIGIQAQFYKYLNHGADTQERVDFELESDGDQTDHTMLFLGDIHLANRIADRSQFATFTAEVNDYLKANAGKKVYAMTLGDMCWDAYWYTRNYCFEQYLVDVNAIKGLTIYHTIGNHDHDMRTSVDGSTAGWAAVDWDVATKYRNSLGPNYYSFNIGRIHYIVMDNIYAKNTTGGTTSDRIYTDYVVSDELTWLRQDLSYVSKDTPIVLVMHAPMYTQTATASLDNASALASCFSGYSYVRVVTGHTHKMWTVDVNNIHEHNSGAICAAWWWAGYYNRTLNIAQDGAPGGYRIMDVQGTEMTSYYKGTGRPDSYQFRTYDRNSIKMTAAGFAPSANSTNAAAFETAAAKYGSYTSISTSNYVYINIWDYNPNWTISVTENGKKLTNTRITAYDPLFLAAYTAKRYNVNTTPSFTPYATNHMFRVQASSATSTLEIDVTDDEGRTYHETMTRPKTFNLDTYK